MAIFLAVMLALAAGWDIRSRQIPNWLSLSGLSLGLACHVWQSGSSGLLHSLAGIGVAGVALLPYAVRGLGAGDVKLLGAVGALMGTPFLLWTMLGALVAGGLLAMGWVLVRGGLQTDKMPIAPAIALGAIFASVRLHGGLLP